MTSDPVVGERLMSSAGFELYAVLPGDVEQPTGGNVYDRRVLEGLATRYGWRVHRTDLVGGWPLPSDADGKRLTAVLDAVPDGAVVLLDGLVAGGVPEVVEPASRRLRIVVLVHLPLPDETGLSAEVAAELAVREGRTLRCADAVVVTSEWAARRLARYDVDAARTQVANPGTDVEPLTRPPREPGAPVELLCVAAVTARKDQLTLVRALARIARLPWRCTLVGPLDRDPAYVSSVRQAIADARLTGRVELTGPLGVGDVTAAYDAADLLVLASRTETFGMVITEALSRGVPVLTAAGGAAAETLGHASDGTVPGLLVPPGDVAALATALETLVTDEALRVRLVDAALDRRAALSPWADTIERVAAVLTAVQGRSR